jgi:serine phosphatase RsbU (regulator of sigma subunit)
MKLLENIEVSMKKEEPLAIARILWVALLVFALGYFIGSIPVHFRQLQIIVQSPQVWIQLTYEDAISLRGIGLSMQFYALYLVSLETLVMLLFVVMALFIFASRRNDSMATFASAVAILYGVTSVPSIQALAESHILPQLPVDLLFALGLGLPLVLFYIFPDGKFVPSWTIWLAMIWISWITISAFFPAIYPDRMAFPLPFIIKSAWYATGIYAQIYRYFRSSSRLQQQQTKWVVFGFVAVFGGFLLFNLPFLLNESIHLTGLSRVIYIMTAYPLLALFPSLLVPVSIGLAVLRYKLWDIDILINQTIVYSLLTGLLVIMYFSIVIVLQSLFGIASGQNRSGLVNIISTLSIAAVFVPLRTRIQSGIDQRFFRSKYDATQILAAFNSTLREEIDLSRLTERLEQVIIDTMQPAYLLTWLENSQGFKVYGLDNESPVVIPSSDPFVEKQRRSPGMLMIDEIDLSSSYLDSLRKHHVKAVVPLISRGELIGWLTLGERLSGQEYNQTDRQLLNALAGQAAPAVQVAHLLLKQKAEALEMERLAYELSLARDIQRTLLPRELPSLPGWKFNAHYQPARSVGGDFYDFLMLLDGRLGVFMGDVTDKGVPAALVMAETRSVLRSIAQDIAAPGKVLELANNRLDPEIPDNMFVTCLYLLLDPSTGKITWANAGHDLPMQWTGDGIIELRATGMPLGLMPGMRYEQKEAILAPGETLLLFTDGLVEGHNLNREMFGIPRVKQAFQMHVGDGDDLIPALLQELTSFTGPHWQQEDDATIVVMRRLSE